MFAQKSCCPIYVSKQFVLFYEVDVGVVLTAAPCGDGDAPRMRFNIVWCSALCGPEHLGDVCFVGLGADVLGKG